MALHSAAFRSARILVLASSSSLDCSGAGTPRRHAAVPRPSIASRPMLAGPLQFGSSHLSCSITSHFALSLPVILARHGCIL